MVLIITFFVLGYALLCIIKDLLISEPLFYYYSLIFDKPIIIKVIRILISNRDIMLEI